MRGSSVAVKQAWKKLTNGAISGHLTEHFCFVSHFNHCHLKPRTRHIVVNFYMVLSSENIYILTKMNCSVGLIISFQQKVNY